MFVPIKIGTLIETRVRIRGTIKSAQTGEGLSRRVILYNRNLQRVAEAMSNDWGDVEFDVQASLTDVFFAHAVGAPGECDAFSSQLNGLPE